MKKEDILFTLKNSSQKDLEQMSFAYIRIVEHLTSSAKEELRVREKARIKIALKHIDKWFNEYDN